MDVYDKAKENSEWGKSFLHQLEPVAERAFTLVEWMLVVGFIKYLQEVHGGVVLTGAYMVLQLLLSVYLTTAAVAITPIGLLGQRSASGRARSWLRFFVYILALVIISSALHYTTHVVVAEVTLSEKG
jgi:hypothetical protein